MKLFVSIFVLFFTFNVISGVRVDGNYILKDIEDHSSFTRTMQTYKHKWVFIELKLSFNKEYHILTGWKRFTKMKILQ